MFREIIHKNCGGGFRLISEKKEFVEFVVCDTCEQVWKPEVRIAFNDEWDLYNPLEELEERECA